jgi:glycosyltransferase involved in cell wall biosynthesis
VELCGIELPPLTRDFPIHLTNLAQPQSPLWQRLGQVRQAFAKRHLQQPDAINLHFSLYSAAVMDLLPPVPVTFSFHGPWALESLQEGQSSRSVWLKQQLEKYVYRHCDRFIVLSRAFGTILHQSYGIPWEQITIIPGGVNTQRFSLTQPRSHARLQLGWPLDRPILFTPRRLVHRMGLDKLLQSMVSVRQAVPDIWLAIAGKGPLLNALQVQIEEMELTQHVKLLGYVPDEDLPVAYQAADLTVVPSQSLEGFGLILVESLASGTPALCTPVGGMPDIIHPFSPDLVTDDITPGAIADRMIALLNGPLALPGREACQAYAREHFNWKNIAPQVRNVLLR